MSQLKDCCICGSGAQGEQWHNRDNGYGICINCAAEEKAVLSEEEMKSLYGIEGKHYYLPTTNK